MVGHNRGDLNHEFVGEPSDRRGLEARVLGVIYKAVHLEYTFDRGVVNSVRSLWVYMR